ncbi:hypothetical protein, partial [Lutimaribacter pacificus]|uniref:hypothetical protein n=1 Tax=Lutimaribacter pacificus TaxID=391948 RepID=UPI001CB7B293
ARPSMPLYLSAIQDQQAPSSDPATASAAPVKGYLGNAPDKRKSFFRGIRNFSPEGSKSS